MLAGNRRVDETGARVLDTHRIGLETEEIGKTTLDELKRQGDILKKADGTVCLPYFLYLFYFKLIDMDKDVEEAGSTISSMGMR